MSDYIDYLERQLHEVDQGIERAQKHFEASGTSDKVKALAELTRLRQRHADLDQRIAAAKEKGTEAWSSLHTSFREEADALKDTLDNWLTRIG
ncbi:hypothetical protein [Thalassovita sp.]|uniref:hypothetical protein n=1 Tax=Thalassovita sp. TaxID=1979401 RepID=UPI002B2769C6|nr:hypothetical protein [Thalassovita sp.]